MFIIMVSHYYLRWLGKQFFQNIYFEPCMHFGDQQLDYIANQPISLQQMQG